MPIKQLSLFEDEPLPVSDEAKIVMLEFERQANLLLEKEMLAIKFKILLWGPGIHSESAVAKKRLEIRKVLAEQDKHYCWLSEDFTPTDPDTSLKSFELTQARLVDQIVMLVDANSPGVIGEMHDFCSHKELLPKILLFFPETLKKGYAAPGIVSELEKGYRNVERYTEIDIVSCHVLTKVREWIRGRRSYEYSTSSQWKEQ